MPKNFNTVFISIGMYKTYHSLMCSTIVFVWTGAIQKLYWGTFLKGLVQIRDSFVLEGFVQIRGKKWLDTFPGQKKLWQSFICPTLKLGQKRTKKTRQFVCQKNVADLNESTCPQWIHKKEAKLCILRSFSLPIFRVNGWVIRQTCFLSENVNSALFVL